MSKFVDKSLTLTEVLELEKKWGESAEFIDENERYGSLIMWNNQTGELLFIVEHGKSSGKTIELIMKNKTQFHLLVTIENDEPIRKEATNEAERAINSFVRFKNQCGCMVSENKLTFSVSSGPIKIN